MTINYGEKKSIPPSESPGKTVKRTVADLEDCHPSDLGTLSAAVDVNRLENLKNPPIEFNYCGYKLKVQADETIIVER